MRDVTLWRFLRDVDKAVIEGVEFDEGGLLVVARVRPVSVRGVGVRGARVHRRAMTAARGAADFGRWTSARCWRWEAESRQVWARRLRPSADPSAVDPAVGAGAGRIVLEQLAGKRARPAER